jgi:hypothetical protein
LQVAVRRRNRGFLFSGQNLAFRCDHNNLETRNQRMCGCENFADNKEFCVFF